jgi:hypothetical protein
MKCEIVVDLKEDYKGNKLLLYAGMRKKVKAKAEFSILHRNGKLAWTKDAYLKIWMECFKDLLNIQNDGEDSTENNRVPENGNTAEFCYSS